MRNGSTIRTVTARALTALLTVWCLGCAGYDPLIDSILGRDGGGMDCGSEIEQSPLDSSESTVSATTDSSDDVSCHCVSCHSTTPQSPTASSLSFRDLEASRLTVADVASVTRAPVAPPPEFASL